MRILLLIMLICVTVASHAQDSTTAVYINGIIQKIESRLSTDIVEIKDTSIYDAGDSLGTGPALTVHTAFYTNPQTMLLDKIVEKSLYKKISTELTIYFLGNKPVRFTNRQWEESAAKIDFDIYYMNDNSVYCVKRNELKGSPDGDAYLKWCYQLQKEYLQIVQEYNQMFASRKSR
jgi:hypothetical protein